MKNTSDKNLHNLYDATLDPFLWISGLLNDVFVSGFPALKLHFWTGTRS